VEFSPNATPPHPPGLAVSRHTRSWHRSGDRWVCRENTHTHVPRAYTMYPRASRCLSDCRPINCRQFSVPRLRLDQRFTVRNYVWLIPAAYRIVAVDRSIIGLGTRCDRLRSIFTIDCDRRVCDIYGRYDQMRRLRHALHVDCDLTRRCRVNAQLVHETRV